jgi:SWI/SNF-related matrix-associated actin-dependent regulator 1 of chromatin subfamily A
VNNGYGWNFSGASNTDELNMLLTRHCMIRKLKVNVLKELPPKVYHTIPLEFDRKEYDKVEQAFNGIDWKGGLETIVKLGGNAPKSDVAIVAIQKLREVAGLSKLGATVEWIRDFTEQGRKLVVFTHHRQVIETIQAELEKDSDYQGEVGVIYGGVPEEERAEAIARFQADPRMRVIIVGIQAGGVGITLTSSNAVAFVQLPWGPGEISQCADRVAENTIEEDMAEMILAKGNVLDEVLDAGQVVNSIEIKQ